MIRTKYWAIIAQDTASSWYRLLRLGIVSFSRGTAAGIAEIEIATVHRQWGRRKSVKH